jgi:hypothetical protein
MPHLPSVFIGSSSEGLAIAKTIERALNNSNACSAEVWNQGLFRLGDVVPTRLQEIAMTHDFAVLVFSPDEILLTRGDVVVAPRDNLVFELGLFCGILGLERTCLVASKNARPKLPTDFIGLTHAKYSDPANRDGVPDTIEACGQILDKIKCLGKLRHPRLEQDFHSIEQNFRRAFKFEHPVFQSRFENWFTKEKEESGVWGQGLLRIRTDYAAFLSEAFEAAKSDIFSTSGPSLNNDVWDKPVGRMLLRAQMRAQRNNGVISTRLFLYKDVQATPKDVSIMKSHQQYGVRVFVYDTGDVAGFEPNAVESQWDMIDDGRAIGITKSTETGNRVAHWYFDDPAKVPEYILMRKQLLQNALPLDEWLLQEPQAA